MIRENQERWVELLHENYKKLVADENRKNVEEVRRLMLELTTIVEGMSFLSLNKRTQRKANRVFKRLDKNILKLKELLNNDKC